jgi:hypothetical protein
MSLPDQNERLRVLKPRRQPVDIVDMVVMDRDRMTTELLEARKRAQSVE